MIPIELDKCYKAHSAMRNAEYERCTQCGVLLNDNVTLMQDKAHLLIDAIQEIRYENNELWMDILRIAFETAPQRTSNKMKLITQNDSKVKGLSQQLGELK